MENETKKPEVKEKKAGGKKKNKPSGNPGGRSRAKSTVLANFQKNTLANNTNANDSKKPIVTGMNQDKFKNLLGMFDKKPEDTTVEKEKPSFGKMNSDRFAMFNKNNSNTDDSKPLPGLDPNKPRLSIKERMEKLMQSKEDSKVVKKIDPILEKLRENNNDDDEDEDSYDDDLSDDNDLDISEGNDKNNDDLEKSESLSEENKAGEVEVEAEVSLEAEKEENNSNDEEKPVDKKDNENVNTEVNKNESQNEDSKTNDKKKDDLDKSEDLDD